MALLRALLKALAEFDSDQESDEEDCLPQLARHAHLLQTVILACEELQKRIIATNPAPLVELVLEMLQHPQCAEQTAALCLGIVALALQSAGAADALRKSHLDMLLPTLEKWASHPEPSIAAGAAQCRIAIATRNSAGTPQATAEPADDGEIPLRLYTT